MTLSPTAQKFILHWGEMGARWGVNRTIGQIHALLFLSTEPLDAEAISAILNVARSNVSTSLRELQGWGLIRVVHQMGDRRDYFTALQDVWEIFLRISEERKRRELDPTLTMLRECTIEGSGDQALDPQTLARMQDVLDFLELLLGAYADLRQLPPTTLRRMLSAGSTLARLLGPEAKS